MFSRSSVGGMRQGIREIKETAILIKRTFFISKFLGRSLVLISPIGLERLFRLWFVLGLLPEITKEGKKGGNLNKSTFFEKVPEYYSGVMDKEKQEIT